MITPLTSAGLILSYKCNSRCRHCLFACSPEWSGWMDIGLVARIYEGTLACGRQLQGFHLAGGEAFLNFPLLLESVRLATHYGIPIDYVETNAGWFTDEDSAIEKLSGLREAGLRCLLVSASPFHAEHIPIARTLGVIRASIQVFGEHGTIAWRPEFLRELVAISDGQSLSFEDYVGAVGVARARQAATYDGQLVPGGRSPYGLSGYLELRDVGECFGDNCSYELLRSGRGHFDPYGNIVTGWCSGITVGEGHDLPAAYCDFDIRSRPIIETLCTTGVRGLLEMATTDYGYVPADGYAGKCHLCVDIRRHLVAAGTDFLELAPKQFYGCLAVSPEEGDSVAGSDAGSG